MSGPVGVIDADRSMWQDALRLSDGSSRRLVVLDEGRLADVIDEKTLTDRWPYIQFVRAGVLCTRSCPGVCTLSCHTCHFSGRRNHAQRGIDGVPVVDRRGKVLGLVTATEIIRLLARGEALARSASPALDRDELDVRRAQ
jgi:CBS-domain-containing membrane protein